MDQDSTNGSAPDKRNWRERLGIGAKEMPKLSDEFREEPAKEQPAEAEAAKPAPRPQQPQQPQQQPVTKPAPMAPRAPRAAAPGAAPSAPARAPAASAPAASPPRPLPRVPDNAAQEALAEKLRAQRAAAEKLAEQRVQAARDRAEGKGAAAEPPSAPPKPVSPPVRPSAAAIPPASPAAAPTRPRASVPPPPPGARPKFSFAEEPAPSRAPADTPPARTSLSTGAAAPLNPPRPALGGERGQPPFLRPSTSSLGARPQPPYKPVEPGNGYGSAPRLQAPAAPRAGYSTDAAPPAYPGARGAAVRRPPALENYPRPPEPRERDFAEDEQDEGRAVPRLGRPVPTTRGRAPQEELDEVFEDEAAAATPRQRASARDYQAAYGEGEDAFGEDQRRSSGPWLLLLAILAAALVTGGVLWYYNNSSGNVAGTPSSSGEVPVVSAPEDPAKVAPDAPANGTEAPAVKKKQIYDRIVGEQEVIGGGQVQSTEEIPVQPTAAQPADEVPAVEPTAGGTQIPEPDAATQGTDVEGLPSVDEPPPLPLPPAGSDQQGSLDQKGIERIAAASAEPEQGATAPPPAPPAAPSTSSATVPLPPPEKATDGAALVSGVASTSNAVASEVKAAEPAVSPPVEKPESDAVTMTDPEPPPPPKKKPAAKKPPAEEAAIENLGAEPVVLVPPAKVAPEGTQTASNMPAAVPEAPAAAIAEPEKKKRTILDLFQGGGAQTAQAETQVAAVQPQPQPQPQQQKAQAPKQQAATGTGFVIQLASFRSETEARQEYGRLSSLYPTIVGGLPQQIRQTTVGGSPRYQLGLGPLPSRSDATMVCSALITAGESDCIVRGL